MVLFVGGNDLSIGFPKRSLGSIPNVQNSHGRCGLLVEYGEENAIGES